VEQELFTLPEHPSSRQLLSGFHVHVARSLVVCVMFCRSLFFLLYFCHLAIVLSILIRFLRLLVTPLLSSNFSCKGRGDLKTRSNYLCPGLNEFKLYVIFLYTQAEFNLIRPVFLFSNLFMVEDNLKHV
jgi:hypothetical protein